MDFIVIFYFRDKLEDEQEFEVIGDIAELQAKAEAEAKAAEGQAANGADNQPSTSATSASMSSLSYVEHWVKITTNHYYQIFS